MANVKSLGLAIDDGSIKFKPWLTSFSPEIFEVDFSNVIKGKGPSIYLDPDEFYTITHITPRMKDVLQWGLTRTAGLSNKGTIYLATGFGGGKSHLLTLLYHIFNSKKIFDTQLLAEISLTQVPDVKIVAVDGHNLTYPIKNSKDLGVYLKQTKDETIKALEAEGKPIILLMDEFVVYLAKLKESQQTQEIAHIHTLISAINSTHNCVIVITTPKGASVYGKEVTTLDAVLNVVQHSSAYLPEKPQPLWLFPW